jgi:hypothetical protein
MSKPFCSGGNGAKSSHSNFGYSTEGLELSVILFCGLLVATWCFVVLPLHGRILYLGQATSVPGHVAFFRVVFCNGCQLCMVCQSTVNFTFEPQTLSYYNTEGVCLFETRGFVFL